MRNYLIITFAAALVFIGLNAYSQQNVILDSDSAKLFEGFGRYFTSPAAPEKTPVVGQIFGGEAVFKVIKVTNIRGNDPFNPIQPVYNFGGVIVANVDDLIECVRGGVCKSGTSGGTLCNPQTVTSAAFMSVIMGIATNTNQCGAVHSPVPAPFNEEAFYVFYSASGIIVGPGWPNFAIVTGPTPSSKSGSGYLVNPGSYTMVIQYKTTGQKWSVNFKVSSGGSNTVTLTAISIKPM